MTTQLKEKPVIRRHAVHNQGGAFAVIEARDRHPLLPIRLLADRNRTGPTWPCWALARPCSGCSFPHPVPAGGLGILGGEGGPGLPADDRAIGVTSAAAAAAVMLLALIITAATIRIRRADLAGVNPI